MLINPHVEEHFKQLSAHSDVGIELVDVLKPLGEYELRGGGINFSAIYAITNNLVFCAASGMGDIFWRLSPKDTEIALASGGQSCDIGPEWIKFTLFRSNWPKPDLAHWALRSYNFARTGD